MKTTATIILNRNLPNPTDKLYEHLIKYDGEETDVYVLEAGSEKNNLSQYCTWHADSDEIYELYEKYKQGPVDPMMIVPKVSIKLKKQEHSTV